MALAALEQLSRRSSFASSSTAGRRQARAQSRRGDGAPIPRRRSPTRRSARRCSIPRARPGGRRGFCGRCRCSRRRSSLPSVRLSGQALALPRGHDLSVAGPALSLGAAGGGQPHHPPWAAPAIIMERFDPEQYLRAGRDATGSRTASSCRPCSRACSSCRRRCARRYDLSSLEVAIHAAAPCPVQVKEQMIEWWGPIIHEYYGATEALGFTACDSAEWLAHRGTVGRVLFGELHVLDDDDAARVRPARRERSGSRPRRRSSISTIRRRPRRRARPTAR